METGPGCLGGISPDSNRVPGQPGWHKNFITRARPLAAQVLKWVSLLSVVDCRQCHKQAP